MVRFGSWKYANNKLLTIFVSSLLYKADNMVLSSISDPSEISGFPPMTSSSISSLIGILFPIYSKQ